MIAEYLYKKGQFAGEKNKLRCNHRYRRNLFYFNQHFSRYPNELIITKYFEYFGTKSMCAGYKSIE